MKLTRRPPTITSMSEGSQSFDMVRKASIFVHLHMPLMARPTPKMIPITKESSISDFLSFVVPLNAH